MGREKYEITVHVDGYAAIDKIVSAGSQSGGRVYVPKSWIGRRVKVVLLDPLDEQPEE